MYACTLQHRSLVTKGRATYFLPCKHGAVGGDGVGRGVGGGGGQHFPALSRRNRRVTVFYTALASRCQAASDWREVAGKLSALTRARVWGVLL